MADNVRNQASKTSNDFNNLASARRTPDAQTANGQPLTRKQRSDEVNREKHADISIDYHSLFYSLLSVSHSCQRIYSHVANFRTLVGESSCYCNLICHYCLVHLCRSLSQCPKICFQGTLRYTWRLDFIDDHHGKTVKTDIAQLRRPQNWLANSSSEMASRLSSGLRNTLPSQGKV